MAGRLSRRTLLKGGTLLLLPRLPGLESLQAPLQTPVPNSTGLDVPRLAVPPLACDCHIHIYDPDRFPMVPSQRIPPSSAAVLHYRLLQRRLGMRRVVVVTPRNYGTRNAVTLDAIAQLGSGARGVAVLHPTVTDEELKRLHAGGIRGIRFSLNDPATAVVSFDMVEELSARVADMGWHVQFNLDAEQIVERAALLRRLRSPIVFDHMGHLPPVGVTHPSHRVIRELMDRGRTWIKLSGAYMNSRAGEPYADVTPVARTFVAAAPERLVWGSDWPHPTEPDTRKPNDALLLDILQDWAPDPRVRETILVSNPAVLYGFNRAD